MQLRTLLLVCLSLVLSACSTTRPSAPAVIQPPPVALVTQCQRPSDLPEGATAQDLATWTIAWIGAYGCERSKRQALIESWPR